MSAENTYKYVYGPVPSRRLGISLGISPIPKKTCNYSCIYCQLGRTDHMTNRRSLYFPVEDILAELDRVLEENLGYDVITIVGEGEPTLYIGLGKLIEGIMLRSKKPVAVITNGALLYNHDVRAELMFADIVLPTMDAWDQASFQKINRPHGSICFDMIEYGIRHFSQEYPGQLWIELMLIDGINDDDESLKKYKEQLGKIRYDRLYINTPVRPPAESDVKAISSERMDVAVQMLGGTPIDLLESEGFHSEIKDDYEAIRAIITRHPMNQYEMEGFLNARECSDIPAIMKRLREARDVEVISYKGYDTFRLR